ncbi:unnamed protein product [Closterium sp. Yama58-4]|nr:unnamed protein product [Closterium sp. Yama58-4]
MHCPRPQSDSGITALYLLLAVALVLSTYASTAVAVDSKTSDGKYYCAEVNGWSADYCDKAWAAIGRCATMRNNYKKECEPMGSAFLGLWRYAKNQIDWAAFRRQLVVECTILPSRHPTSAMHTAFASSLCAATAAIASALRDHPVLLSLHLALTAVDSKECHCCHRICLPRPSSAALPAPCPLCHC